MRIKTAIAALTITLAAMLTGCGAPATPVDLAGTWTSPAGDPPQFVATVTDDQIEIQIVNDDTKGLYWKGTFPVPDGATGDVAVTSAADTEALSTSILGSGDASKTFTYAAGKLSFDFTMLGVTKTVAMSKG